MRDLFGSFHVAVVLLGLATVSSAGETKLNGHTFTLPDGFEIELVATGPLVNRPITASFDEQGRLYASDSSGTNDPVKKQLEDLPHRVVRLEDTDGDGVFDKSVVFADKLMFPEGTLFYDGSLYVATPPSIWKLTDTDGDGKADEREEWFQGKTLTGCANDLHGPYLGPDGFIYWCKGAFAEQEYTINGKPFKTKASHIFRMKPDKSEFDVVMNGGMDNPVDVVFLPDGERIFTTTFLVHPGNGRGERDGLLHAVYGGVYGKDWNTLDGHPRTGEVMPTLCHMGAAAPCGLTTYESTVFGDDFYGNLFASQFNTHKVSRHVLTPKGATYESKDSDFVVSDNSDFHPTDVLEDADGSLLIVDTGGWYKLCCPTSQLHKPDILGAIYRVRKTGARKVEDPRGLKIDWEKTHTSHVWRLYFAQESRPAVRVRAAEELYKRRDTDDVKKQLSEMLRRSSKKNGKIGSPISDYPQIPGSGAAVLWLCARIGTPLTDDIIRDSLRETKDPTPFRHAILHAFSLKRLGGPDWMVSFLRKGTVAEKRVAAEALGRIGDKSVIPDLLKAAGEAEDRFLEHSITYAIIELNDIDATENGVKSENSRTRRVALIAIDQMPGGKLTPNQVIPLLASSNEVDLDTANWLLKRHPEWGNDVAGWFTEQLAALPKEPLKASEKQLARLESQLATFTGTPTIQQLLAKTAEGVNENLTASQLALRVMAGTKVKELPPLWADTLAGLMEPCTAAVPFAIATARSLPGTKEPHEKLNEGLLRVGTSLRTPMEVRLDALAAIPTGLKSIEPTEFDMILSGLSNEWPVSVRSAAADVLSKATLTEEQLLTLCEAIKTVSPLELDRVLGAFAQSTSAPAAMKLLETLKEAAALTSLRVDSLRQRLSKYSPDVIKEIDGVEVLLNVDAATQRAKIEELLAHVKTGDVRRGQVVFNSSKAACLACHKFGYGGGMTGPDLTKIGSIRQERDLLESILYPSLSFVRSYEPVVISTVDGKVINGLIRNETAEEILLATGPNKEERVRKAEIDEMKPSTVSIMPAGLDKQLSQQDLLDLVAFMKNAK